MRRAVSFAVLALSLAGLVALIAPSLAERFLFFPTREDPGPPPVLYGVTGEDIELTAGRNTRIHAWWYEVPDDTMGSGPMVLLLHGNAGHIGHRIELAAGLIARGVSVLMLEYRGYGRNKGKPSEEGVYEDAAAGYSFLSMQEGGPGRIVLLGRSMGGAVAAHLASSHPVGGVILESAFTSLGAMARAVYPFLPGFLFQRLDTRFSTVDRIGEYQGPLLVVHGTEDELVPLRMGLALLEAGGEGAEWLGVQGAGHNDVYFVGGPRYFETLASFCFRAAGRGGEGVAGREETPRPDVNPVSGS